MTPQVLISIALSTLLVTGVTGNVVRESQNGGQETNVVVVEQIDRQLTPRQLAEIQMEIANLQAQIYRKERLALIYEEQGHAYQSMLEDAESDLAKARDKKVMVYRDGQFIYESDPDAVSAAQQKVDRYQSEVDYYSQLAESYYEEISLLEEQTETLEALLC